MGIDTINKFHYVPVSCPTMHNFMTEMCIFLLKNGASWDIFLMHCGIDETGLAGAINGMMITVIS